MRGFLRRHWFLTTLALLIAAGMTLGVQGLEPALRPVFNYVNPRWTTAFVLLLMSFSLESGHLWAAFRRPRPVLLGCAVNFGLLPALAWMLIDRQQTADFRLGLMIAAAVPCTTAAASVMTRKARGNDAVSLLISVATNLACFAVTPLWLQLTTSSQVVLPTRKLMVDLLTSVLLPTVVGQALRQPPKLHDLAVRHKTSISVTAQVMIELLVLTAALRAGAAWHQMQHPAAGAASAPAVTPAGLILVWGSCILLHVVGLVAGWLAARATGSSPAEAIAVAFGGSQKTLPVGVYVAELFGREFPFALLPMLLYHSSQLFFDTWLASRMGTTVPTEELTGSET